MWIELHLYGTGERVLVNIETIRAVIEGHKKTTYLAVTDGPDFHINENYDDVVHAIIRRNCGGVE